MIDRAATAATYPGEWRAVSMFGSPGRRMAFWLVVGAYFVWAIGDEHDGAWYTFPKDKAPADTSSTST